MAVGNGYLLDREPSTGQIRLWSIAASGAPLAEGPLNVATYSDTGRDHLIFPLGGLRLLENELLHTGFHIVAAVGSPTVSDQTLGPWLYTGQWDDPFWGHELLALDDDYVLKWWAGTGDYVVVRFDRQNEATNPLVATALAGTHEALRRGARVVNLGQHRLLEWLPATGHYRIWAYHFEGGAGEIFDPAPVAEGQWDDPTQGEEILVAEIASGETRLLLWQRETGRIRLRRLDPLASDPMSGAPISEATYPQLASPERQPPTQSLVKNLVVILQRGRSFDSYFGHYCQAAPGSGPACTDGALCCEGMPSAIPGASACTPLDVTTDAYVPSDDVACMIAKMDGSLMDGYADPSISAGCGDPRAFACAARGDGAGPIGIYQGYAAQGALADRFFQSTLDPDAALNLIYLAKAAHGIAIADESGTQITGLIADAGVPWSLYLDKPNQVLQTYKQLPPLFDDPHWTFFRSPEEIQRDVALEQLPSISIVLSGPHEAEQPGDGPAAVGIQFVKSIVDAIQASPRYAATTLVMVSHLTSGGFFDHVAPPPPPAPEIDSQTIVDNQGPVTQQVPYGPRVPLLALGRFARSGLVSHVPLELASLTVFLEWNWLGSNAVGKLHHRDLIASNLGSLLDPATTGALVPPGPVTVH